jgi:hypothetical protein
MQTYSLLKDNVVLNVIVVEDNDAITLNNIKEQMGATEAVLGEVDLVVSTYPEIFIENTIPHPGAVKEGELFYPKSWVKDQLANVWSCPVPVPSELNELSDSFRWNEMSNTWSTLVPTEQWAQAHREN